jgi:hypothetical protein
MKRPLSAVDLARIEKGYERATAPHSLSAEELRAIADVASRDPLGFAERINSLGVDARSLLDGGLNRPLDRDHSDHSLGSHKEDHSDRSQESLHAHEDSLLDDPRISDFTRKALATLAQHARTGERLVRLSLTVPRPCGSVRLVTRRFARECEARGILIAEDRSNRHASAHAYGIALTDDVQRDVEQWCRLTGASLRRSCRFGTITGWRAFQEDGEVGLLEPNFDRVVAYGAKAYSDGRPRREGDVVAAGVMLPLREGFLGLACPGTGYGASRGLIGLPGAGKASTRECARCGRELPRQKRSHAQWCGRTCKTLASRERRREVR